MVVKRLHFDPKLDTKKMHAEVENDLFFFLLLLEGHKSLCVDTKQHDIFSILAKKMKETVQ